MAQFDASVVVNVVTKGEQRLNQIKASINEINRLSQNLKPINLLSPGGGKLGNAVREALKPIKDFAREAVNGTQRYSNTLSGATGQAQTFKTVLDNVKIAAGGYDKQVADVKNYAAALAGAEKQARELAERQRDLLTDARTRAGITPQGQSTLLGSDEAFQAKAAYDARLAAERALREETSRRLFIEQEIADVALRAAKLREIEAKRLTSRRSKGKLTENLFLGAGFPLLFGGGAGAVGGGVLGSLLGDDGFGGQIFLSALGTALDGFAESTANLGAELNKAKPDVDAITERLGVVGTGTEAYINALQDSDQATKAAQAATDELAQLVGQDGVRALKDFGAQTTELGNELAKAFTLIAAAAAKIISQSSAFKEIQTQLPRAVAFQQAKNSDNPEIQRLFSELEGTNAFLPGGSAKRAELGDKIIEKQLEINRLREEGNRIAAEGIAIVANEKELATESAELVNLRKLALAAEGDQRLTLLAQVDEQVAKEALLAEKAELLNRAKLGEISYRAVALALQEKQIKLDERLRQIREGLAKNLTGGGSGSGVDKEAQAQKALASERTKQFDLQTKIDTLDTTKLEKINIELGRLEAKRALKQAELELTTEDSRVLAAKLKTLSLETQLLREQLELQKKRAAVEKTISALKDRQRLDALSEDLNRELSNALTLPTGNTFQDEQNALLARQDERRATTLRKLNNQIKVQNTLLEVGTEQQKASAKANLPILEEELALYERMLPAIAAAEQQQLKFNQTLSLVEGPVNAFVNGLTEGLQGIIDGTMSAEEAFSKMLKGMAQALMQTAAQMIAQYIAIGIARAFAGMGGGGGYGTGAETPLTSGLDFSSAFGGRAGGGPVNEGLPYIVGENGAELFVPGKSGTVVNNDDFADAAAAMGAGSSSSEESGEALEMATAARGGNTSAALAGAIQAFADSGSAMATASSNRASNSAAAAEASALQTAESYFSAGKSTVSFDTYRVGEMDVVTREDAMKIGMESAKKAEANVYKGLRNMPAVRGRSGVK